VGLSLPVRLRKRQPLEEGSRCGQEETEASFCSYYDPNLAPLYEFDLTQPSVPPLPLSTPTKHPRLEEERPSSASPPEDCREEQPKRVEIEVRSDDPFIIVRKEGKKQRQTKAKTIRKDKAKTESKVERREDSAECGQGSRLAVARSEEFDSSDSPICPVPVRREISTLQELARLAQLDSEQ
jgi:bifunctional DNA-binding transcriptional regulator/antitoxin component of YhaV-PrlF toxin-antitoxin module